MLSPRPFRALRFVAARVDLGAVLGRRTTDPRHATRLLDAAPAAGDGSNGAARRARFRLADWRRAGIVARDAQPSLTLVKRTGDDGEAVGLFCAVSVHAFSQTEPPHELAQEEWFAQTELAVDPVVASLAMDARVRRVLDNAADREADATWSEDGRTWELWVIDDETTAARITALLDGSSLKVLEGGELLAAHAAHAARQPRARDDDRAQASQYALCFLHPEGDAWPMVPRGAALLPLGGEL